MPEKKGGVKNNNLNAAKQEDLRSRKRIHSVSF
jgi:hypothetical protein